MSPSPLLQKLTSPQALTQASRALDAAWSAWNLRRKPRSSASVLRRSLVSSALTQGATMAGLAATRNATTGQVFVEPLDDFRGPIGDVPVLFSPQWDQAPMLTEVNGKLILAVGPSYQQLNRTEQEELYHSTVNAWLSPRTALALGAGSALGRAALHRGLVGKRGQVSKKRAATLALAITAVEAALLAGAHRLGAQARRARVAREQSQPRSQ